MLMQLVLGSVRRSGGTIVSANSAAPNAIGERAQIFGVLIRIRKLVAQVKKNTSGLYGPNRP